MHEEVGLLDEVGQSVAVLFLGVVEDRLIELAELERIVFGGADYANRSEWGEGSHCEVGGGFEV